MLTATTEILYNVEIEYMALILHYFTFTTHEYEFIFENLY